MKKWFAGFAVLALIGAAGGPMTHVQRRPPASAEVAPETEPVERRVEHRARRRRVAPAACDANIRVKAAATTWAFAQNVFYESWIADQAGGGEAIDAYSPAPRRRSDTTGSSDEAADDDGADVDGSDGDPSAPTMDLSSGSGSAGSCADGTLSDSIGRPGACSHHGGVGWRAPSSGADVLRSAA